MLSGITFRSWLRMQGLTSGRVLLSLAVVGIATVGESAAAMSRDDAGNESLPVTGVSHQPQTIPPYRLISLRSNVLYDAALTPDIGVDIGISQHISLSGDFMYGWWSNTSSAHCWRLAGGNVEGRYYFSPAQGSAYSRHHVGVYGSAVKYDFRFGATRQGQMSDNLNYAAGISYGYTLPLARRISLDFSIGIGYMWGKYMKYRRIDNCDVWQSTNSRRWFGPTRAEIALVWHISGPNAAKGGRK